MHTGHALLCSITFALGLAVFELALNAIGLAFGPKFFLTGLCQFFPAGEGTNSSLKSLLWNLAIKHRDQDVLRIEN